METSQPCGPAPFIPRRWRVLASTFLLTAGLLWASWSVLSLCSLIQLGGADTASAKGISLRSFFDPHYPDRFPFPDARSTGLYYKSLLAACALFGLGLWLGGDVPSKRPAKVSLRGEIALVCLVCFVAIFMRFYLGNQYPFGLHYDESTNAMIGLRFIEEWKPENQARIDEIENKIAPLEKDIRTKQWEARWSGDPLEKNRIQGEIDPILNEVRGLDRQLEGVQVPVFTTEGFGKATAHMYQIGWAMKWFGTSIFSIRFPTMLAGVFGVLALYVLLRILTDVPTALLGAGFLAAMRWHVNFSRVAYDAIEAPFLITLTTLFFFLAFRHWDQKKPLDEESGTTPSPWKPWSLHLLKTSPFWLLAGYSFGLCIYSYKPLYLFPGVLLGFLTVRWVMQRQMLRWNLVGLVLFLAAAFFSAKEMLDYRKSHPEAFGQRMGMVSIVNFEEPWSANWNRIRENLRVSLPMFHLRGDANPRHNHPFAPMTHPLLGALFPLGLAWALVRWRSRLGLFSLGWFVAMLLPMVLSIEAPNTLRAICCIPVICIWSAVALRQIGLGCAVIVEEWAPGRKWAHEGLRWTGWAIAGLLLGLYWRGEYGLYFRDQVTKDDPYIHFDAKFVDMAHYVNGQRGKFYVVGDANGHNALRLLNQPGLWRNHLFLQQELPAKGAPDEDALFIVMEPWNRPDENRWVEWLYGPEVTAEEPTDPFGKKIFAAYRVPGEIKEKHRGFSIELETTGSGTAQRASFTNSTLSFSPSEVTLPAPFKAEGKAMWVIPEGRGGAYRFRLETPDRFQLQIDSETILDASAGEGKKETAKELDAGAHQVRFSLETTTFRDLTQVSCQSPGDAAWQPLGGEFFHDRGMLPNGLRMTFWHGSRKWDGKPNYVWADPFINMRWNGPYKFPMSIEWKGWIEAPLDGGYVIGTEGWDYSKVEIDGKPLLETPGGKNQHNRFIQGTVQLTQGKHPILIRYTDNIGGGEALRLYWQVPGSGKRELVPEAALTYE